MEVERYTVLVRGSRLLDPDLECRNTTEAYFQLTILASRVGTVIQLLAKVVSRKRPLRSLQQLFGFRWVEGLEFSV